MSGQSIRRVTVTGRGMGTDLMTEMIGHRVSSIKSLRKRRRNDHPVCIQTQILSGEDILMEAHECIPADEKGYFF